MTDIITTRSYRLTGITELLGTIPADPDLFSNFIASKAPSDDERDAEIAERLAMQSDYTGMEARGLTVFHRDPKSGALVIRDHQMRGFFKEALRAYEAALGILQTSRKVDRFLFVEPRNIPLCRADADGRLVPIMDDDGHFERPLRKQQYGAADCTFLTSSEIVNDPWTVDITVTLIENKATARSKAVTWEAVEMALDYGRHNGLLQFRSGGYGRFTWEAIN